MLTGYILSVVMNPEALLSEIKAPPDTLVVIRSSIAEAIQIASYVIPDAVLVEHRLPDGEGLDLVMALQNHPSLRHVPVVLLGMDDLLLYQWLGVAHYLPNRREVNQLNHRLAEILGLSADLCSQNTERRGSIIVASCPAVGAQG